MDLQSTNSRLPRNTVVDPETQGNAFDVSARLLSIATYSVTGVPTPRGDKVIHLEIRVDQAKATEALESESELRWSHSFATSQDLLTALGDKALADYQSGDTDLLDPDHL
jgi:hypothetical protein